MLIFLESINDAAHRRRFEALYDRYKEPMMIMAQQILHNHHDAEDAVHEVFLNIATKRITILDTIANDRDLKYYLLASVKNTALNMEKRKSRLLPISVDSAKVRIYLSSLDTILSWSTTYYSGFFLIAIVYKLPVIAIISFHIAKGHICAFSYFFFDFSANYNAFPWGWFLLSDSGSKILIVILIVAKPD